MNSIVPLSGGNSATLRSPAELSERQRRPVTNAVALVSPTGKLALEASYRLEQDVAGKKKPLSAEERDRLTAQVVFIAADVDALNSANDLAVVAFVKEWSRPEAITLESVLNLPGADYDTLRAAVAPLAAELFVSFAPNRDPNSPTAPSSGSATRSEGSPLTVSQTSGEPTSSSRPA